MHSLPYIKQIEATGLRGDSSVRWQLRHGVNILSGINGSGKSTLLLALSELLRHNDYSSNPVKPLKSIKVTFDDNTIIDSDDVAKE
ncbi:MAG: hypothetical protein K2N86_06920, partial [Rikenellaceae bacterium]|nr:hypothetical protein [Rikenellaceae bacterium]